jgi:hypothetical protein
MGFTVSAEPIQQPAAELNINPFLQMMFQIVSSGTVHGSGSDSDSDSSDTNDKDLEELLRQDDPTEAQALVKKITSRFQLPIGSEERDKVASLLNGVPLKHRFRPLIVQTALKVLNTAPSEFPRPNDQVAELVKSSFFLSRTPDEICSICHTDLIESCDRLSLPDQTEQSCFLVCGRIYGDKCRHLFCYSCFQSLQATLMGDSCPSCRESLYGTVLPEVSLPGEESEGSSESDQSSAPS